MKGVLAPFRPMVRVPHAHGPHPNSGLKTGGAAATLPLALLRPERIRHLGFQASQTSPPKQSRAGPDAHASERTYRRGNA